MDFSDCFEGGYDMCRIIFDQGVNAAVLYSDRHIDEQISFPSSTDYAFTFQARGDYAGESWPILELRIDGNPVGQVVVNSNTYQPFEILANISQGNHQVSLAFINDYYDPGVEDRNLYLDYLRIELGQPLPSITESADLNCDSVVNIQDFGIILSWWGKQGSEIENYQNTHCPPGTIKSLDLSPNGIVDEQDLAVIFSNWGM